MICNALNQYTEMLSDETYASKNKMTRLINIGKAWTLKFHE